jgi:hypothetical protein
MNKNQAAGGAGRVYILIPLGMHTGEYNTAKTTMQVQWDGE